MLMSVLHVTRSTDAGLARCVLDLSSDQVDRGWNVTVASPTTDGLPELVQATGAHHVIWPATREPGLSLLSEYRRLTAIVGLTRPKVVHLHSSKAGLVGRLAVRGRVPTIFQPNAWSFLAAESPTAKSTAARWERFASRWTTALVCVSDQEKLDGERVGISAPWVVMPNAVDVDAFPMVSDDERRRARARLGLAARPLAVCVGRLTRQKGQDVLLGAWPRVRAQVPDAELVLVGIGPTRSALEATAPAGVTFAGFRTDVPDWMAAADVVVLPSRWEGMSYVMLEAMASGRPVIASEVGGAREAIGAVGERTAGALVPAEHPEALARAVVDRLRDPVLAAVEGAEGVRRVHECHRLTHWCKRMAELTAELAAGGNVGNTVATT
jgi:glycosyltransferase involved in cell wall biosynthesis